MRTESGAGFLQCLPGTSTGPRSTAGHIHHCWQVPGECTLQLVDVRVPVAVVLTKAKQTSMCLCLAVCIHLTYRASLVSGMSTNKALLKKLEDTLLRELSSATGNILDNQDLIATLESAKEKAVDISQKLTAAKSTAKDIEEARVRYSSVATRGAVLFFVMAGLSAVNNMYEYSLAAFLKVFKQVGA